MAQPYIQTSFNGGEWAPQLWARTDLEKYNSGAALLRNFFVDFRGGASTRSGSQYCLRAWDDATAVRLITFQSSIGIGYAVEFGDQYLRFFRGGAPVVHLGRTISGITQATPAIVTTTINHGYSSGDVVSIINVGGMTQVNNRYFRIVVTGVTTFELRNILAGSINSTGYDAYTAGGTVRRVYTVTSPYAAADLALLKFAQNVNSLIITHPDYTTQSLTYISETSWTLTDVEFGSSLAAPENTAVSSTLGASAFAYAYVVTAVDENGQESNASSRAYIDGLESLTTYGTNTITWDRRAGADYYNVYKAVPAFNTSIPLQTSYGYIGNTKGTTFQDTNIAADYSVTPPDPYNPFATGYSVESVSVLTQGNYAASTAVTVTLSAPSAGGVTATGSVNLEVRTVTLAGGGLNFIAGDELSLGNGITVEVNSVDGGTGAILTFTLIDRGTVNTNTPANPIAATGGSGTGATFNATWRVASVDIILAGSGYDEPSDIPTVTFSAGTTTATGEANLEVASVGNPGVIAFVQQRSAWAGVTDDPNTFFMSRPGLYYNFDKSFPTQGNDSITAPIVSGQLANIKSMLPQPAGLIIFTDGPSYLVNGGSAGSAIAPDSVAANAQSFVGANDMPPIVANYDILYVQARGSAVRNASYNFYANVFTGADISAISSHLFFGYELTEWAWDEEPYKIVWAVRSDGALLSLTFIKDQEFVAWAHHDTSGSFKSVCSVVEPASIGYQNFLYAVVERTINGVDYKFIEYFPERATSDDPQDYWTIDSGLSYSGAATASFGGAEHLAGETCTGLADGEVIAPFVMPGTGFFTLPSAASDIKVGLAFTPQLQTLYLNIPDRSGTSQTKMKKINGVALRVAKSLGLKVGSDSSNLVEMKDLIVGNVGRMTNEVVAGLVTGDAFAFSDPKWQEQGQIFVEQHQPYPATILGYIPQVAVGDTQK